MRHAKLVGTRSPGAQGSSALRVRMNRSTCAVARREPAEAFRTVTSCSAQRARKTAFWKWLPRSTTRCLGAPYLPIADSRTRSASTPLGSFRKTCTLRTCREC